MGFWTYTYACIKKRAPACESMGYDGRKPVVLALPDGTFLKEDCYDGYGIICGKDVLELVVDWNRGTPEALAIMDKHIAMKCTERADLLTAGKTDGFRLQYLDNEIPWVFHARDYLARKCELADPSRKREVGIMLATYNWEQEMLKYPIKFVKNTKYSYDKIMGYSENTQ